MSEKSRYNKIQDLFESQNETLDFYYKEYVSSSMPPCDSMNAYLMIMNEIINASNAPANHKANLGNLFDMLTDGYLQYAIGASEEEFKSISENFYK